MACTLKGRLAMSIAVIGSRDFQSAVSTGDDIVAVDVAVIIPAFNEDKGVGPTVDRVRGAMLNTPYSFEIIVVDDGSTDGTAEQAEQHGARVIRVPENRG